MHHNAAIVVLATLVTKAAGYATLPKAGSRKDFAPVDTATESVARVVPDTCEYYGTGCACSVSELGCTLLGTGAVERNDIDLADINYCYDYCFADGVLYKSTTGGQAPCYSKCGRDTAIFWQTEACSDKYQLQNQPGSVFYDAEQADESLCPATAESGDFCTEYDEDKTYNWVGTSGTCQKAMKRLRNEVGGDYSCAEPFTAECSKTACHSLIWMGLNSMNGGIAYFCQYNEDTGKCQPGQLSQVDDMDCEFEMEARRKLQEMQAELRK